MDEKRTFGEVIKANRGRIVKGILVVGVVVGGVVILTKLNAHGAEVLDTAANLGANGLDVMDAIATIETVVV